MTWSADAFVAMFWTAIAANDPVAAHHVLRIFSVYHPFESDALILRVMQEAS